MTHLLPEVRRSFNKLLSIPTVNNITYTNTINTYNELFYFSLMSISIKLFISHRTQYTIKLLYCHLIHLSNVFLLAMVVRFITRRFIGEYDPNLEKVYSHSTTMGNESVSFEILDAAGQLNVKFVEHFVNFRLFHSMKLVFDRNPLFFSFFKHRKVTT